MNHPTLLNSRDIAALIPQAKQGEYLGNDIIEINVNRRHHDITEEEDKLLRSGGYVPLFDHLVIGWRMYIRESDAVNSMFFRNETLPISESRFSTVTA